MPVVTTYAGLRSWVKSFFGAQHFGLMVLVGTPGLSKSRMVQEFKPDDAWYLRAGRLTAFQLYKQLYRYRDKKIILDDVEPALRDVSAAKILMAVCESEEGTPQKVAWYGSTALLTVKNKAGRIVQIPQEFCTTSEVCVICNDWSYVQKKLEALDDRALVIYFEPSPDEVHKFVSSWFPDQDILAYIGRHLDRVSIPSIRHYVKSRIAKRHKQDWRSYLQEIWTGDQQRGADIAILKAVCRDPKFASREQQCKEFMRRSGESRATFYRKIKQHGL